MLPTFVIYNHNYMTVNGVRKDAQHLRFSVIFNERAAIVFYPNHSWSLAGVGVLKRFLRSMYF